VKDSRRQLALQTRSRHRQAPYYSRSIEFDWSVRAMDSIWKTKPGTAQMSRSTQLCWLSWPPMAGG
jgi:hypothetical protein